MRIAFPDSVHQVPLGNSDAGIRRLTELIARIRNTPAGATADLLPLASETVETAEREGAILLAMVIPDDAAPAMLTGVLVESPDSWDIDAAEATRNSVENVGGRGVRETGTLETSLGPAVMVQRVPGVEQARAREPLALQLQALIPDSDAGRMLLLTLSGPSRSGWEVHQRLFAEMVASACPSEPVVQQPAVHDAVHDEESFEEHTYRL